MILTGKNWTTKLTEARLMSTLSGNPVHVDKDVFVWNGELFDRATAVIALLKVYNKVPLPNSARQGLYDRYTDRFGVEHDDYGVDPSASANIWFYRKCKAIKAAKETRTTEDVKQQLITLHTTYA
jgi:hypothetical protein